MGEEGHVRPDLVGAPGQQRHPQPGDCPVIIQRFVLGGDGQRAGRDVGDDDFLVEFLFREVLR